MTINQIYVTEHLKKYFENDIFKYSSLQNYTNINNPTFIYGFTIKDFNIIENNKSICVIIWTGGDCDIKKHKEALINLLKIKKYKNVYHIAISNFIENDLKRFDIKYLKYPFFFFNMDNYKPVIKGNSIYIYCSLRDKEEYGYSTIKKIEKLFPTINFIYCTNSIFYEKFKNNKNIIQNFKCYTRENLISIYKKCFIGIRLTKHDGLSATTQELGCMGIKTIWNGNTPSALNYKTINDIISHIENEKKLIGTIDYKMSESVKKFLNIKKYIYDINTYIK